MGHHRVGGARNRLRRGPLRRPDCPIRRQSLPCHRICLGVERLIDLLDDPARFDEAVCPHAYLIRVGNLAEHQGGLLAERLRDALPELRLVVHCDGGSFKSQFKRADKSGADLALILGEEEAKDATIGIKNLRKEGEQITLNQAELIPYLQYLI